MAELEECGHDSSWLNFWKIINGRKLYTCGYCLFFRR